MTRLTPDPTFYPTASEASAAPPERVGYVATIDATSNGNGRPDSLAVLDLDERSSTYGELVGRVEMPNVGD